MIIKRTSKFALSALLLSAGILAYAQGEKAVVTLGNGQTKTWTEVVTALNNPDGIKADPLPEPQALVDARTAWNNAVTARNTAETEQTNALTAQNNAASATTTAKQLYDQANLNLSSWQASLATANSEAVTLRDQRDEAKEDVADKQAQVKVYQDQIDAKNTLKASKTAQKDENTATINANNQTIASKTTEKENLEKTKTDSKYWVAEKSVAPWLTEAAGEAKAFAEAYDAYLEWYGDNEDDLENATYDGPTGDIYMNITKNTSTNKTLEISFNSSYGWTKYDQAQFMEWIENLSYKSTVKFYVTVYFGSTAGDVTESISGITNNTYSEMAQIISDQLAELEANPTDEFMVSSGETKLDEAAWKPVQDQIDALATEISTLQSTNATLTSNNETLATEIAGLETDITNLTNEKKPYDEALATAQGTLTQIQNAIATNNTTISTLNANIKTLTDPTTETDPATGEIYQYEGKTATCLQVLLIKWHAAEDAEDAAETAYRNAQAAYAAAVQTVSDKLADYQTEQRNYEAAQATADTNARQYYNNLTLSEDVTASTMIKNFNGTFNGGNKIITLDGISTLFQTFTGTLQNLAINGEIAESMPNATFTSVAFWNGASGEVYTSKGQETAYTDFGALGFGARAKYGVNLQTGQLTALNDYTKVYNITIYEPNRANNPTQYVVVNNDKASFTNVKTKANVTIPDNMFAKSETNDLTYVANVFYGENNECEKVVIKDKTNFYAPVNIAAKEVVYDRKFSAMNSVCLPFKIDPAKLPAEAAVCTFELGSPEKFWFTKHASEVAANTPVLLVLPEGEYDNIFKDLTDVEIAQTPESQKVMLEGADTDKSRSYGLFKSMLPGEFAGESNSYRIYGLTTKGEFKFVPAESGVSFPAMRMVVYTEVAGTNGAQGAPRKIGILDEMGIEITDHYITTGIESVESDASSLTIEGGRGEIKITSDADYGTVTVYSVDGKAVAMPEVVEGTTSVSLQSGIYIVMGKKVLVK